MTKTIDPATFKTITKKVIELLEGGYYNPGMFADGRLNTKYFDIYKKSGETMFGLDRFAGFSLFYSGDRKTEYISEFQKNVKLNKYQYKNKESEKFWTLIDQSGAAVKWSWNYRGGQLQDKLSELAAEIMYPVFIKYANTYFSEQARQIVYSSPELIFNFSYATWNGPAFFNYYADAIQDAIEDNIIDPVKLNNIVIDRRINGPNYKLPRSGEIMKKFFLSSEFSDLKKKSGGLIGGGLLFLLLGFGGYLLFRSVRGRT